MMDEAVLDPGNNGSETGMRASYWLVWCRQEIRIASTRKPGNRGRGKPTKAQIGCSGRLQWVGVVCTGAGTGGSFSAAAPHQEMILRQLAVVVAAQDSAESPKLDRAQGQCQPVPVSLSV